MNRLQFVIAFTHDIQRLKTFYRDAMRFETRTDTPSFVSFETGGASLSLLAVPPSQKREFELCFHTGDLDADVRTLKTRGVKFLGEPRALEFGRVIHARDPEGNLVSLLQPVTVEPPGRGLAMTAVLNCRDVSGARAWYRDRLGLPMLADSPWWVELDAGETRVALHPVVDHEVLETNNASPVTIGFATGDLDEWVEELHLRGVEFTNEITDRGYGRFAEALDPDGNIVLLRDSPGPPTLEEKLAEEYETGDEPRQVAIRKAVNKNSKAVSRLVKRPEYHNEKPMAPKPAPAAAPAPAPPGTRKSESAAPAPIKRRKSQPSVRGAGPDRTRRKPIKKNDPERVRIKPAVGHQQKATARTLGSQRVAAASASRTRPIKRAATRVASRRGAKTKRGTGRSGKGR